MPEVTAPMVTAIIVVRNGEAFLAEAIDSIIGQTFASWELLIVDDGSTDRTPSIVAGYEARCPDVIRGLRHPDGGNHGIAASRNLGLGRARGRYIAFLDADDIWLPHKLSGQVAIMEADPQLGMVYGRTLIWHSWSSGAASADFYYPLGVVPDRRYDPPVLFRVLLESRSQTPTTCNALMRAGLFAELGGFEDRFRLMFEDQTFFAKALAFAPAYVSGETWARYRQHPGSCSAQSAKSGSDARARLDFLRWLQGTLVAFEPGLGIRRIVWQALARASAASARQWLRQRLRA